MKLFNEVKSKDCIEKGFKIGQIIVAVIFGIFMILGLMVMFTL